MDGWMDRDRTLIDSVLVCRVPPISIYLSINLSIYLLSINLSKVLKRQGQDATQRSGWQLGLSGKIV